MMDKSENESVYDEETLKGMKMNELRELIKKYGLKNSRQKADVIKAILEHFADEKNVEDESEVDEEEDSEVSKEIFTGPPTKTVLETQNTEKSKKEAENLNEKVPEKLSKEHAQETIELVLTDNTDQKNDSPASSQLKAKINANENQEACDDDEPKIILNSDLKKDSISTTPTSEPEMIELDVSSFTESDHEDKKFVPRNSNTIFSNRVVLNKSNADIDLDFSPDMLTGIPQARDGFSYMWSSVKATYGVMPNMKACFEVKINELMPVNASNHLYSKPEIIVGFSTMPDSLKIGDSLTSFGMSSNGRFFHNKTGKKYGSSCSKNDVIGCCLDYSESRVAVKFSVNSKSFDSFVLKDFTLAGSDHLALFPHVSTKNIKFTANFGLNDVDFRTDDSYSFINALYENLEMSTDKFDESGKNSVIMLISLPNSGTTQYISNFMANHKEMNYYPISHDFLLKRMDNCVSNDTSIHVEDSQEELFKMMQNCIQTILKIATSHKRNIIIDQGDIHNNKRRKVISMFPLVLFTREAKVFVLSESKYRNLLEKSSIFEIMSQDQLDKMKSMFDLPSPTDKMFQAVQYVDLDYESAQEQIKKFKSRHTSNSSQQQSPSLSFFKASKKQALYQKPQGSNSNERSQIIMGDPKRIKEEYSQQKHFGFANQQAFPPQNQMSFEDNLPGQARNYGENPHDYGGIQNQTGKRSYPYTNHPVSQSLPYQSHPGPHSQYQHPYSPMHNSSNPYLNSDPHRLPNQQYQNMPRQDENRRMNSPPQNQKPTGHCGRNYGENSGYVRNKVEGQGYPGPNNYAKQATPDQSGFENRQHQSPHASPSIQNQNSLPQNPNPHSQARSPQGMHPGNQGPQQYTSPMQTHGNPYNQPMNPAMHSQFNPQPYPYPLNIPPQRSVHGKNGSYPYVNSGINKPPMNGPQKSYGNQGIPAKAVYGDRNTNQSQSGAKRYY